MNPGEPLHFPEPSHAAAAAEADGERGRRVAGR